MPATKTLPVCTLTESGYFHNWIKHGNKRINLTKKCEPKEPSCERRWRPSNTVTVTCSLALCDVKHPQSTKSDRHTRWQLPVHWISVTSNSHSHLNQTVTYSDSDMLTGSHNHLNQTVTHGDSDMLTGSPPHQAGSLAVSQDRQNFWLMLKSYMLLSMMPWLSGYSPWNTVTKQTICTCCCRWCHGYSPCSKATKQTICTCCCRWCHGSQGTAPAAKPPSRLSVHVVVDDAMALRVQPLKHSHQADYLYMLLSMMSWLSGYSPWNTVTKQTICTCCCRWCHGSQGTAPETQSPSRLSVHVVVDDAMATAPETQSPSRLSVHVVDDAMALRVQPLKHSHQADYLYMLLSMIPWLQVLQHSHQADYL